MRSAIIYIFDPAKIFPKGVTMKSCGLGADYDQCSNLKADMYHRLIVVLE